jgi:hypothetical protein
MPRRKAAATEDTESEGRSSKQKALVWIERVGRTLLVMTEEKALSGAGEALQGISKLQSQLAKVDDAWETRAFTPPRFLVVVGSTVVLREEFLAYYDGLIKPTEKLTVTRAPPLDSGEKGKPRFLRVKTAKGDEYPIQQSHLKPG